MQQDIQFFSDDYQLSGTLHLPENPTPPLVIGTHGLLSTGDSPKQIALAEQCVAQGIAFFRFDHRGCGKSEGDFAKATTWAGRYRDLASAIAALKPRSDIGGAIGLFGSSFGGAISLAAASQTDIAAVVTVAAPLCSESIRDPYVNDPANPPRIFALDGKALFFDLRDRIRRIRRLLIFHGDNDAIVPFSNALELYAAACEPKRLVRQPGGDHPMSDPAHQHEFMTLAAAWFKTYLLH